jgi:ribosomal protein S18 acetylase RimI-like enzyme
MPVDLSKLRPTDLPAVLAIEAEIYPAALVEDLSVFSNRLDLPGNYCLAAKKEGALVGYLIAHAWQSNSPPSLGVMLPTPARRDVLYIHDLGVSRHGRGERVGRALVGRALGLAASDGMTEAQLIAVQGAESFWRQLGFANTAVPSGLGSKLRSYGVGSVWMTRPIG